MTHVSPPRCVVISPSIQLLNTQLRADPRVYSLVFFLITAMFTIVDLLTMKELATFSCHYKATCRVAEMEEELEAQGIKYEFLIWPE